MSKLEMVNLDYQEGRVTLEPSGTIYVDNRIDWGSSPFKLTPDEMDNLAEQLRAMAERIRSNNE